MVKEVKSGLFCIEVPLPNSPLKELNSYVIKSDNRNLIIDTGFNREICLEAMLKGISELDIDLSKTDFMITHMHADHSGLVTRLATETSIIYFSRIDAKVYDEDNNWKDMIDYAEINGFPADELMKALHNHPGYKYSPKTVPKFNLIDDNDIIEIGNYRLKCVATPGHTEGHICLYDEDKKILFSGDHILYNITPHIESWAYQINALKNYMDSLEKVYNFQVDIVLPGHRTLFTDLKARIDELKEHHAVRADEVMDVLGKAKKNAYDIASGMSWDIDCERWEDFPIAQKWFATGEAIAHLRYLESEGRIKRNTGQNIVTFSSCAN